MPQGVEGVRKIVNNPVDQPPIVDPVQFLDRPFERLETGRLSSAPTKTLLRYLPTLPNETGLVLQGNVWYVIKASNIGIPRWLMPSTSDVLLHSHPVDENEEENPGSIPSMGDYINSSTTAGNFISSHQGLTQYWAVTGEEAKKALYREMFRQGERFGKGKKLEYLKFLKEMGARFMVFNWDEIDSQRLSQLMGAVSP